MATTNNPQYAPSGSPDIMTAGVIVMTATDAYPRVQYMRMTMTIKPVIAELICIIDVKKIITYKNAAAPGCIKQDSAITADITMPVAVG